MERVYIGEVVERQSDKGGRYWRVTLVIDGRREVAYVWDRAVAAKLVPRTEALVALQRNGKYPRITAAEPVTGNAGSADDASETVPALDRRDRLILRQVALKAATELVASWQVGTVDDAETVLRIAERFYEWLAKEE